MDKLLSILSENARVSNKELAAMLETNEEDIAKRIAKLERDGVLCGYPAVIDWDKVQDKDRVVAFIELKVTPRADSGFDEIASEIMAMDEVEAVYLMSGGFDLAVYVTGRTFQEVAMFVAKRLSPLQSVVSTATHFVLKKYKDRGTCMNTETDERSFCFD